MCNAVTYSMVNFYFSVDKMSTSGKKDENKDETEYATISCTSINSREANLRCIGKIMLKINATRTGLHDCPLLLDLSNPALNSCALEPGLTF